MAIPLAPELLFFLMLTMANIRAGITMTTNRLQDREKLPAPYGTDRLPEHEVRREGRSVTFYSDGSYTPANGLLAAAIAFQDPRGGWQTRAAPLGRNVGDQHDAELFGVCLALRTAVERKRAGDDFRNITIYTDSKKAVEMLMPKLHDDKDFPIILGPVPAEGKWTFEEILDLADELAQDSYIHVRWIKGHNGIIGNAVADTAAKTANKKQNASAATSYPLLIPEQYMGHGPLVTLEYAYRAGIRPLPALPEGTTENQERDDEIDAFLKSL
ncbi:ribonuclease H-like protein [Westerdykella ornata]|uniref:Ribonuclease H-like protein n=1 Tax=Westerdykella ornata TaxID=318751 RepID=A0A6A6J6M8_WESOR|nr:ribonuclease H-like protein [Westerdykella ornata]KAF2271867.1 ribonuclease H-like protein [Westerdykella ornata]